MYTACTQRKNAMKNVDPVYTRVKFVIVGLHTSEFFFLLHNAILRSYLTFVIWERTHGMNWA